MKSEFKKFLDEQNKRLEEWADEVARRARKL
jgi:hypothetical protein